MRTTLYLLSASSADAVSLIPADTATHRVSVVLLEEIPAISAHLSPNTALVSEDPASPGAHRKISYADLLRMMFEADTVVAL